MRLLMLGGTEFAGRAIVEEALRRGWEVTAFNRGTHPDPPGVTGLRGDRTAEGGLAALEGGSWDLAVDTWSWGPDTVRDAARALAGRVGHYSYVSSRSVYALPAPEGAPGGEAAPVVEASPDAGDEGDYPRNKRGAELAVEREFGGRSLLLRAGLIIGPYEDIGRLPWWLNRIHRGGEVLAPGPRELPLQYIDVRDLASWTLDAAAEGLSGPYDTVSEPGHATMESLLTSCAEATGSDARLRWTDPEVITGAGIEPWTELPVWLPPGELHQALHGGDVSKVMAAGLRCRPVAETVADTWAWMRGLDEVPQRADRPKVGLAPDREDALLRTRS
jgi:nucleoside-diphosphate-sugar epimerase